MNEGAERLFFQTGYLEVRKQFLLFLMTNVFAKILEELIMWMQIPMRITNKRAEKQKLQQKWAFGRVLNRLLALSCLQLYLLLQKSDENSSRTRCK